MPRKRKLLTVRRKTAQELIGLTTFKRNLSRKTGIGRIKAASKPVQTLKRKAKRAVGYESEPVKTLRNIRKRRYLFGIIPIGWKK